MICGFVALALSLVTTTAAAADDVAVFAAGSLRAPMTELARDFEQASGMRVTLTFGASGLLRDRIAGGEPADVFASANMAHPQSLVGKGWARATTRFAKNRICLLTAPGLGIDSASALAALLDPGLKLGTSTPKADPGGDYAWEVFHRAERVRPGAFATLDQKARKLTGGPQSPPPPAAGSVYAHLLGNGDADLFLTYCTNAIVAHDENAKLEVVRLPEDLAVGAEYGVAARDGAGAQAFVAFLLSPPGFAHLRAYGFDPP